MPDSSTEAVTVQDKFGVGNSVAESAQNKCSRELVKGTLHSTQNVFNGSQWIEI